MTTLPAPPPLDTTGVFPSVLNEVYPLPIYETQVDRSWSHLLPTSTNNGLNKLPICVSLDVWEMYLLAEATGTPEQILYEQIYLTVDNTNLNWIDPRDTSNVKCAWYKGNNNVHIATIYIIPLNGSPITYRWSFNEEQ